MFPGLFPQRITGKNTQRVFGPIVKEFERENPENILICRSKFDFTNFESQNFVE